MRLIIGLLLACLVCGLAQAASFDCGKAKTKVEKLICSHEEVKELDGALAKVYRRVLKQPQHAARIRLKQHEWLKSRESCLEVRYQAERDNLCQSSANLGRTDDANRCAQHQCLKRTYRNRIAELYSEFGEHWRHKSWEVGKGDIVNGAKYPLCVDFLKNLNSLYEAAPVCEWKVNPAIKSLALPRWEEIDPKANLGLIEQLLKGGNVFTPPNEETWRMLKPEILSRIDQGGVHMWQARISLTSNDKPELVARIDLGCTPIDVVGPDGATYRAKGVSVRVVDERTGKLDKRYDYLERVADVVLHDGKAYLLEPDFYSGTDNLILEEPFFVPETGGKGKITVCIFEHLK
jgi:uncharacterized protein